MAPWIATLLVLGASAQQADAPAPAAAKETAGQARQREGLWPTPEMVERGLKHVAAHSAERYDLSDQQRRELERLLTKRWPRFLQEHERELRPLVNRFYEARMGVEAPTEAFVADWARRARPIWQQIEQEIAAGNAEIERILTPQQRERFVRERHELEKNLQQVARTLEEWTQGQFDRRIWWERAREQDERAEGARPPATRPVEAEPPDTRRDEIDHELDAWARYVAEFSEAHDLDPAQRKAAESVLKELVSRVKAYRDRRRTQIDALERMIADPPPVSEEEFAAALHELYGPIDAIFQELQTRLERIPTDAQKRRARAAHATSQPSTAPQ